jgi:hypothetical protein
MGVLSLHRWHELVNANFLNLNCMADLAAARAFQHLLFWKRASELIQRLRKTDAGFRVWNSCDQALKTPRKQTALFTNSTYSAQRRFPPFGNVRTGMLSLHDKALSRPLTRPMVTGNSTGQSEPQGRLSRDIKTHHR